MSKTKEPRKHMKVGTMVALDLLAIILGLNVFALFHHVIPSYFPGEVAPVALESPAPLPPEPSEPTEPPPVTPSPKPLRSGMWGEKYAEQFTDGEVIETEDSYRSGHISLTLRTVEEEHLIYHVAEIYVSDLKYLRTAMGHEDWGHSQDATELARAHNAVLAISGDHYFGRWEGIMIRNGLLYRDSRYKDVCVLLRDGSMITIPDAALDVEQLIAMSPWQVWSFGPGLMEDGKARSGIRNSISGHNPRSAIGYVEPGHYFFVQVEGREDSHSDGMTLDELAALFEELGCKTAYNLDGGRTASMVWKGELYSYPYYRPVYDIIYITDETEEESP